MTTFLASRGPLASYGLSDAAHGGPPASWSGDVDDRNDPGDLVKLLEGTAKGCQALLSQWRELELEVARGAPDVENKN
jgi:hypothetical protein